MITKLDPGTIFLGGPGTIINDLEASETIMPGHLIERWNNAGVVRLRKSTVASQAAVRMVAIEHSMANKGVNDAYNVGDLVEAVIVPSGGFVWMWVASGGALTAGTKLESNGDGTLKAGTTAPLFAATDNQVTGQSRLRVEAM